MMKNKLIATTILGTSLLFNASAYGIGIEVQNPNGTSLKLIDQDDKSIVYINDIEYTEAEAEKFFDALITTPGLTIVGASNFRASDDDGNVITFTLDQFRALASNPAQTQIDKETIEEIEDIIDAINSIQSANSSFDNLQQTNAAPSSSETQESLKSQIEAIKKTSESDSILVKGIAEKKLEEITKFQDTLFADTSKTKVLSELNPVQRPDTLTTDSLSANLDAITGVVDNRLHGFTATGIAAGDFLQNFGGWVKGLYTKAEQKAYRLTPGYKLDQSGATIGFDTGDDIKIGAAYSFAKSRVNAKGISAKENITSHIGTIYGLATIDDQFIVSGQGSYGISNIKKSRSTGDTNNNLARGKTKGNVMSGKFEVGYDYIIENSPLHVVPSVGIAHNAVSVKGYKETGSGLNRKVGKRTTSRTSALLGVMTKYEVNTGSFTLMPEVHANIDYALSSKNASTKITVIDGLDPLVTPSTKLTKMKYTVGTSVKLIQSKAFNAGVGYDLGLAKKFISHTGSLNVRMEF